MAKENQIQQRIASFKFAFKGIGYMFCTQKNAFIHMLAAILAMILGYLFKIEILEWCLIIFAIGLVIMAELFNTAVEFLTDLISPEWNEKVGKAKDIAAGAVLIAAISAALIGLIIFIPKIF
jgi:diacylglycerol kinase (ATP)